MTHNYLRRKPPELHRKSVERRRQRRCRRPTRAGAEGDRPHRDAAQVQEELRPGEAGLGLKTYL